MNKNTLEKQISITINVLKIKNEKEQLIALNKILYPYIIHRWYLPSMACETKKNITIEKFIEIIQFVYLKLYPLEIKTLNPLLFTEKVLMWHVKQKPIIDVIIGLIAKIFAQEEKIIIN